MPPPFPVLQISRNQLSVIVAVTVGRTCGDETGQVVVKLVTVTGKQPPPPPPPVA